MSTAGFFDGYPRFLTTTDSEIQSGTSRLNLRHKAIIEANLDAIRGRRILDIASHDGRWSFAALMAGAEHVTGIEARESHVSSAVETMREYGLSADRYHFITDDAHTAIDELDEEFDTVFCLGFLYHTVHHMHLLSSIARLQPQDLIVDAGVCLDSDPVLRLVEERSDRESTAVKSVYEANDWILVGWPSVAALDMMLDHAGYGQIEYYDWQRENLADLPDTVTSDMQNYLDGRRVTLRARKSSEGALTPRSPISQTPDWNRYLREPQVADPATSARTSTSTRSS